MCVYCRHKHDDEGDGNMTCEAFPGGIPDEIIRVGYDHREPYDGDGGIMFEPDVSASNAEGAALNADVPCRGSVIAITTGSPAARPR